MISPITGQQVPVEQMAEHMRIALLDPKWKEKSGLIKAGEKEDTLAMGDDVGRSLAKMAAKRKDIFGTDEEVFGDKKTAAAPAPPSKVLPPFTPLTFADGPRPLTEINPPSGSWLSWSMVRGFVCAFAHACVRV